MTTANVCTTCYREVEGHDEDGYVHVIPTQDHRIIEVAQVNEDFDVLRTVKVAS